MESRLNCSKLIVVYVGELNEKLFQVIQTYPKGKEDS